MKEVSLEEYLENKSKGIYRNGSIIPVSESTLRRIGQMHSEQKKADEFSKTIYHFVEIEPKETPRYAKVLIVMQLAVMVAIVFKG